MCVIIDYITATQLPGAAARLARRVFVPRIGRLRLSSETLVSRKHLTGHRGFSSRLEVLVDLLRSLRLLAAVALLSVVVVVIVVVVIVLVVPVLVVLAAVLLATEAAAAQSLVAGLRLRRTSHPWPARRLPCGVPMTFHPIFLPHVDLL